MGVLLSTVLPEVCNVRDIPYVRLRLLHCSDDAWRVVGIDFRDTWMTVDLGFRASDLTRARTALTNAVVKDGFVQD